MAMSLSTPFRYTTPPPRKSATGATADVYAQLASDFGMERPATFVVLSSEPELLTATWALMRESLIAGEGDRTGKELAALGVSLANRCPFCVDAHTMLLHATGDHSLAEAIARGETPSDGEHARVLAWGRASRRPGAPELTPYPFAAAHAPAYIGTMLTFHFINRIASALLTENLLPGNAQRFRAVRSLGGRSLARTVRRPAVPGAGLTLLDAPGPGPDWARGTTVGPAYAALRDAGRRGRRTARRGGPCPRTGDAPGMGRRASVARVGGTPGPFASRRAAGAAGRPRPVPHHGRGRDSLARTRSFRSPPGASRGLRRVRGRRPRGAGSPGPCLEAVAVTAMWRNDGMLSDHRGE